MHGIPRSILYVADSSAELESLARASQIQETVDTAIQEFCTFLSMADGLARQIDPRDNPITAFGHAPTPERLQSALAFLSNLRSGVSQFLLDYEESGVTLEFIRRVSYSRSALYALAKKPSLMNDGRPIHEFRNGKHYWSRAWIQERSRTEPGATP
jgi:hypothetical protein